MSEWPVSDEVEAMIAELLQYADPPDDLQTYGEATARKAAAMLRYLDAQRVKPSPPDNTDYPELAL